MSKPDLGCSIAEVKDEGSGQALVRPAGKVHQLHAEAAAEPHHICWPQIAVHDVLLVQPTQCLAHLQVPTTQRLQHTAFLGLLTGLLATTRCKLV